MPKTILCFGDSNTHGYNAEDIGRFAYGARWTGRLADLLGDDYYVAEEGLSGRTCVFDDPIHEGLNGLSMLHTVMMTHEPLDTMVIMLGTNDTKERFSANATVIGQGLRRLVEKAMITPAWRMLPDILIVAPAPIEPGYYETEVGGSMGLGCSEKSKLLAAEYKKIADELPYCRFFDAGLVAQVHPSDCMHLTRDGHAALAQALLPIICENEEQNT